MRCLEKEKIDLCALTYEDVHDILKEKKAAYKKHYLC